MGFAGRSLLVFAVLYGLVFAVGDAYLLQGQAPFWTAIIFVVGFMGIQYLLAPWLIERFLSIHWEEDEVPAAHRAFVENLCRERGIPMPRLGVIWSGTPNAFAYGRVRRDARVVMTEGLLKTLNEDEVNAVLAHEVGHIAHYDFAVMALAAMAPMLLYQIYAWTRGRNDHLRVVSYAAYLAYWLGQFLVQLLNRTREFGADHFSAEVTREPSALSSALVKICYGMVRERTEAQRMAVEGDKQGKKDARAWQQQSQALGLMGIAAATGGDAMALVSNTPEMAAKVMRWDLVNPWSRVYELGSTHPLTAMRLKALNEDAANIGQRGAYPLPQDARIRWAGFPVEFLFWAAPVVCGFVLVSYFWLGKSLRSMGVHAPAHFVPWMLIALGVTWAARIAFRYRGRFARAQVSDLLDDLTVSQMRPRAVEMEGEVIGHGIPGAIWSADLVLQDESGLMFLYYRSSIPFGRLFFALRSADRLIGERVKVCGWYRRGMKPYVEVAKVEATVSKARRGRGMTTLFDGKNAVEPLEYEQLVERSYSQWIQLAATAVCVAAGVVWLLGVL
ncbi:MAG TPA: M48 family metalloprotease [Acidobacteriaceae bacterium]|jgi:Zn-dependent protease with chaperone function